MELNIFVTKVNFSAFVDNSYWGAYDKFLQLGLADDQFLKLIDLYQAMTDYRSHIQSSLNLFDGFPLIFYKSENQPSIGYCLFGLADKATLSFLRDNDYFRNYQTKRADFFNEIGWVEEEERCFTIESDFDSGNLVWSNVPSDFDAVNSLYQSAKSLGEFL